MQIDLDPNEADLLILATRDDVNLAKQQRKLQRKIARLERERAGVKARVFAAVRRRIPIPDNASLSSDGHGRAVASWPDPVPALEAPKPKEPIALADLVDAEALRRACEPRDVLSEAAKAVGDAVAANAEHNNEAAPNGCAHG